MGEFEEVKKQERLKVRRDRQLPRECWQCIMINDQEVHVARAAWRHPDPKHETVLYGGIAEKAVLSGASPRAYGGLAVKANQTFEETSPQTLLALPPSTKWHNLSPSWAKKVLQVCLVSSWDHRIEMVSNKTSSNFFPSTTAASNLRCKDAPNALRTQGV
eukprot:1156993-Pelagomonas_calceolata.AAC.4